MIRLDKLMPCLRPLALAAGFGLCATAAAQQPAPAAEPPAPSAADIKVPTPAEQDSTTPIYTYEVGGRRDPFKSLLIRDERPKDRAPGLPGMLVDELALQGTIKTKSGWVAMMRGSDAKSYLVKKGTTVFDGEVTDITASDVTFRQNVNDPTNPKPFRDVVKSLNLQRKP